MTRLAMSPLQIFRRAAVAEAVTWALLLTGMVLRYGTETTELGVRVFGMLHGIVFLGYCLVTLLVAVDQRWRPGLVLLALAAAIPPFATVAVDRYVEKCGALAPTWRLREAAPSGVLDALVSRLLRYPARGAAVGVVGLAALTGLALVVGPPGS